MWIELNLTHTDELLNIEQAVHLFPWSHTQLKTQLQKKDSNFGYLEQRKLQGFICIQRIFPEAEIFNIAVHPHFQGKGIGKKILTTLIEKLQQENFQRIFLEVRKSNLAAIRLYESLGFNQFSERKNYYPTKNGYEDALLYALELTHAH